MDYLELVKELAGELRAAEPDDIESVNDLKALEPRARNLARWVQRSWVEIQLRSDEYRFRKREDTIEINADQAEYDLRLELVEFQELAPFTSPVGQRYLLLGPPPPDQVFLGAPPPERRDHRIYFMPWNQYKGNKQARAQKGRPRIYTVTPDDRLILYPEPKEAYTLKVEYVRIPQTLKENCDVPIMPERFHQLIVYHAVADHGGTEEASMQFQRGLFKYNRLLRQLDTDQIEPCTVMGTV